MNSSRFKKFGGLLAVLALLIIACPMAARAYANASPDTVVSIPDATVNGGDIVTLAITINDVTNLSAADIWLAYDKDVVTVDSIADGNLGGTLTPSIDNTNGVAKMNWFSTTAQTGSFTFASVTLHAGATTGSCTLDLQVQELTDKLLQPIPYTANDGTFTVSGVTVLPPTGVGGTAYPPNKVMILAPWIALAAAIIAGATIFLRRRRAQG